jgi:methionyl-tRNA synthetase
VTHGPERILVAVAWPYANRPRHIGHVAGFGVPSDVFARYRAARVLYVALRCIDSLKILFTTFLPHSSQALHELLDRDGSIAGPLWLGRWEPGRLAPGQALRKRELLSAKLDPAAVVASELEQMRGAA